MINKIQSEKDAILVLGKVIALGGCLFWTAGKIGDVVGLPDPRALHAVAWLRSRGFLTSYQGELRPTIEGRDYHKRIRSKPQIGSASAVKDHRDQVLTGAKEVKSPRTGMKITIPSDLVNPTLTGSEQDHPRGGNPEEAFGEAEKEKQDTIELAGILGVTPGTVIWLLKEKRIKQCKGNDPSDEVHLGIFHKGRPRCRECERKRLAANRRGE